MTSTGSPVEITLNPSPIFAVAQCGLIGVVLLLAIMLPLLLWAKLLLLIITLLVAAVWLMQWRRAEPESIIFRPLTDDCVINRDQRCHFRSRQFVSRYLVIIYLTTEAGHRISRVIPRDALSDHQHRLLRRLLIQRRAGPNE